MTIDTQNAGKGIAGEREREAALCRSLLYEALALGFRPPTVWTLRRLGTESAASSLAMAAEVLDLDRGTGLATRARDLAGPQGARSPESLEASYRRLFGHTAQGPISPYETEYGEETLFQKPQEMSDIAGFFKAFGLILDSRVHERIDHISCELEFLAFLARKEAHALETADEAMRSETRKATRLFLKDHLGRFAPSFARRILREDPEGFYGVLAAFCLEFVEGDCDRFEVAAGPEILRVRVSPDEGAPMACGGAEGCGPGACGPGGEEEAP